MNGPASRVSSGKGKGTGVRRSTIRERTIVHGMVETLAATLADRVEEWVSNKKSKPIKTTSTRFVGASREAATASIMHEVSRQIAQVAWHVWQCGK